MKMIQPYIVSTLKIWKETDRGIELRVNGNSMNPLIRVGDSICIRLVEPDHLRMGDIIAFWQNGNVVVHRLINRRKVKALRLFCQKGDNCTGWSWINEEDILGKVELIHRSDSTINMIRGHWTWINPIIGLVMSARTDTYERIRAEKVIIWGHRSVPILPGLGKMLSRTVNSVFTWWLNTCVLR